MIVCFALDSVDAAAYSIPAHPIHFFDLPARTDSYPFVGHSTHLYILVACRKGPLPFRFPQRLNDEPGSPSWPLLARILRRSPLAGTHAGGRPDPHGST